MATEQEPKLEEYHILSTQLEAAYNQQISAKAETFTDLILLLDKTFFILSAAMNGHKIKKNNEYHSVFFFLLARNLKTFRSIRNLVAQSCDQDAIALLRNLIETTITAKYLAKDNLEEKCNRFREFQWVERSKNIHKHRTIDPTWSPFPGEMGAREIDRIQKHANIYKTKYGKNTQNWSGMSLDLMAKECGMYSYYVQAYSVFCLLVHPSFISREQYFPDSVPHFVPSWAPTSRYATQCVVMAIGYLIKGFETYIDVHGVDDPMFLDGLNEVRMNLTARTQKLGVDPDTAGFSVKIPDGQWGVLPEEFKTKSQP